MEKDDFYSDVVMYFKQIISLTDLMIEQDNTNISNILTIGTLAELGLSQAEKLCN